MGAEPSADLKDVLRSGTGPRRLAKRDRPQHGPPHLRPLCRLLRILRHRWDLGSGMGSDSRYSAMSHRVPLCAALSALTELGLVRASRTPLLALTQSGLTLAAVPGSEGQEGRQDRP